MGFPLMYYTRGGCHRLLLRPQWSEIENRGLVRLVLCFFPKYHRSVRRTGPKRVLGCSIFSILTVSCVNSFSSLFCLWTLNHFIPTLRFASWHALASTGAKCERRESITFPPSRRARRGHRPSSFSSHLLSCPSSSSACTRHSYRYVSSSACSRGGSWATAKTPPRGAVCVRACMHACKHARACDWV